MLKRVVVSSLVIFSSASLAGNGFPPEDVIAKECEEICDPSSKYCESLDFIYKDTERDPDKAAQELERICKPWAAKSQPPKDCIEACKDIRSEKKKTTKKKSESNKTVDYFIDSEGNYNPGWDKVPGMPDDC